MAKTQGLPHGAELNNRDGLYQALLARDSRFDGRFFVAVTSTGIYCRPVCRVRMPLQKNCRFFEHPAGAEQAGFRPCLRCRPELAPGLSRADACSTLAHQAARLIDATAANGEDLTMLQLAARLGVTDRHLRRIFVNTVGVPPLAYLNTRRLLQAKQLLTDTNLAVTSIAHAAGFGSVRRFNAAFSQHYRLNPSDLRRRGKAEHEPQQGAICSVSLGFRPPYCAASIRRFLMARAVPGVEYVSGSDQGLSYQRSLALRHGGKLHVGWLAIDLSPTANEMRLSISEGLAPAMSLVLQRVRHAMDLDAQPDLVDPAVETLGFPPRPGLRLPGAFDGFESAVRVILGQQVSVAAARTLAHRLVLALGDPLQNAPGTLNRLFPSAAAVAAAEAEQLGRLGIVRQRVNALQTLARAVLEGNLSLERHAPLQATLESLRALPGIGEWTAQLIAMRSLAWPDAFPASDLALLKALGTRDPQEAERRVQASRPWRAYAVIRCWQTLEAEHD